MGDIAIDAFEGLDIKRQLQALYGQSRGMWKIMEH